VELRELIKIADEAYDEDGLIMAYHEDPEGNHGDTLAKFIATELAETFEEGTGDVHQLDEAARVMDVALRQLDRVHRKLINAWGRKYNETTF